MYSQPAVGLILQDNMIVSWFGHPFLSSKSSQRRIAETVPYDTDYEPVDVVPTGSWVVVLDHPTRGWFGQWAS